MKYKVIFNMLLNCVRYSETEKDKRLRASLTSAREPVIQFLSALQCRVYKAKGPS